MGSHQGKYFEKSSVLFVTLVQVTHVRTVTTKLEVLSMARLVEGGSNPWEVCGLDVGVWPASNQLGSLLVFAMWCVGWENVQRCSMKSPPESILEVGKKSPSTQFGISYTPLDVSRRHVCFDILSEMEREVTSAC